MPLELYKVLHLAGLILVFLGFGGALLSSGKPGKMAAMLHGIGMLLLLVAGFGMLARMGIHWPWPGWVFAKFGVWLLLGAMPVLVKRGILSRPLGWLVAAALGVTAAYLAIYKPF